jgi:hypothetical protein
MLFFLSSTVSFGVHRARLGRPEPIDGQVSDLTLLSVNDEQSFFCENYANSVKIFIGICKFADHGIKEMVLCVLCLADDLQIEGNVGLELVECLQSLVSAIKWPERSDLGDRFSIFIMVLVSGRRC